MQRIKYSIAYFLLNLFVRPIMYVLYAASKSFRRMSVTTVFENSLETAIKYEEKYRYSDPQLAYEIAEKAAKISEVAIRFAHDEFVEPSIAAELVKPEIEYMTSLSREESCRD